MFFSFKATYVLNKNNYLTGSQRAVLECTLNRRYMYNHFFVFTLGCFSTILLLATILTSQEVDLLPICVAAINFIFTIANLICMLHDRSIYIKALKEVESYFGFFPFELQKMLIENIDSLFRGGMLPPEYVALEWSYKTDMYIKDIL